MNIFRQQDQAEIRKAIEEAVLDALETDELSARIITHTIEFTKLEPQGMKLNIRMGIQVNELDEKEKLPE